MTTILGRALHMTYTVTSKFTMHLWEMKSSLFESVETVNPGIYLRSPAIVPNNLEVSDKYPVPFAAVSLRQMWTITLDHTWCSKHGRWTRFWSLWIQILNITVQHTTVCKIEISAILWGEWVYSCLPFSNETVWRQTEFYGKIHSIISHNVTIFISLERKKLLILKICNMINNLHE